MDDNDATVFNEANCVICRKEFKDNGNAILVTKGIVNFIQYSNLRGDSALELHLTKQNSTTPPGTVLVHEDCRREYVDSKRAAKRPVSAPAVCQLTSKKQKLRSRQPAF